jgi:hypothetical protein
LDSSNATADSPGALEPASAGFFPTNDESATTLAADTANASATDDDVFADASPLLDPALFAEAEGADEGLRAISPSVELSGDASTLLAGLSGEALARALEQCGPHPSAGTPGCDRGLGPGPQPTAQPDLIETAGAQAAVEPLSPQQVVQAAASAVTNLVTSGLARTGAPDLTLAVVLLTLLFLGGLGLRRLGRRRSEASA